MNSTELLEVFREEMNDMAEPYLWSDALVYRYIDDAQKMFCRHTEGIEDAADPQLCRIEVVEGQEWYDISPKVLKLREVVDLGTGRQIALVNSEKATAKGFVFDGRQGPVSALVSGLSRQKLRAWPVPNEDKTLELRVFRLPKDTITDDGDQELEIEEQHHLSLLLWVKSRAYGREDAETFDRNKSEMLESRFMAYCDKALKEQERARRNSGTVIYGGL